MTASIIERLHALGRQRLAGMRRGLEKESLRATSRGRLAMTPHPLALGSALTHPSITTDFSESQLELITGVHPSARDCMDELWLTHQFVYRAIEEELLWVSSMPCDLPADENIPIGSYGSSNVGRAKSVYRMGLGHRYGRRMQTICGIHYNWSRRSRASGVETYFSSPRSSRLAANLQREIQRPYGAIDRGVKKSSFYVLRNNRLPAALVELGFLSNSNENASIQKSQIRQDLAEAVARGILAEKSGRTP